MKALAQIIEKIGRLNVSILVLSILLLATTLRLYRLDYQSLWHDELHSMNEADPDRPLAEVIEYCKHDQPPAYFLILHYWTKLFGFNDYSGRLPAAIIGVIGVLVMYFLGKEFKNVTTGLIAAFITAFNYFHILHSQEARFYSLLFLFSALSYLFFIKAVKRQKVLDFFIYTLSTTALLYTHYYGLVVFASQALLFLIIFFAWRRTTKFFFLGLLSALLTVALVSPWISVFIEDNTMSSFWIAQVRPSFIAHYYFEYFRDFVSCVIFALVALYFAIRFFPSIKANRDDMPIYVVLFGWLILSYLIPLVYSFIKMPMLISRYTMIVVPAIVLLIALGFDMIENKMLRASLLLVVCVSSITGMFFFNKYYTEISNEQFREAAEITIQENKNHGIVYSYHGWYYNYYFKTNHAGYIVHLPWETDYKAELEKNDNVWVLSVGGTVWEPLEEQLREKNFKVKADYNFSRARATCYEKPKP